MRGDGIDAPNGGKEQEVRSATSGARKGLDGHEAPAFRRGALESDPQGRFSACGSRAIPTDDGDARRAQPIAIFVPGASARVAVLRLAPSVVQPPPSGVFT